MLDAYYTVNLDQDQTYVNPVRAYDGTPGFNFNMAELSLSMDAEPAGFRLDLVYGPEALGVSNVLVLQGYGSIKLGPTTVDLGRFVTPADLMTDIPTSQMVALDSVRRARLRRSWKNLRENWRLFSEDRVGLLGLGIIILYALLAAAHPILMNTVWSPKIYDPFMGNDPQVLENPSPPSWRHLLGTDPMGRDVLSQLMFSTRNEFVLSFLAATITVVLATSVGALAAYYGGWIDSSFMRLADLINILPFIAFLVVLSAFIKMTLWVLAIVLGILSGFGGNTIIFKAQAAS